MSKKIAEKIFQILEILKSSYITITREDCGMNKNKMDELVARVLIGGSSILCVILLGYILL